MRLICLTLSCLINVVCIAQTRKKVIEGEMPKFKETFYVLKSDENIRQGAYEKKYHGARIKGQYENNRKVGVWEYYDRDGEVEQKIDFTNKKVLFAKPFLKNSKCYVRTNDSSYVEVTPDQAPLLEGGNAVLFAHLNSTLRYPASARRMGIDGKVIVSVVITKEGKMTDVKIEQSLSHDCDEEAIRIIKLLREDWIPGKLNGEPVDMKTSIPLAFKLAI